MAATHLVQLSVSVTKTVRTIGKNKKLTGFIHLLEKIVAGIGFFSLKMYAKYVPCLQVQFATESLISTPQQRGNILIDKTHWFWLRLQSAHFTIPSTVIFKLLAKFTAEHFDSEWNSSSTTRTIKKPSSEWCISVENGRQEPSFTFVNYDSSSFSHPISQSQRKMGILGWRGNQRVQQYIQNIIKIARDEVKLFVNNFWGLLVWAPQKTVQQSFRTDSEGKVDKQ